METTIYIAFFILFAICGYLIYQYVQLERKLKEQDVAHKKALAEAGNAITDTLKIAFENLKKNANEHNKISGKITENSSRIHRIEQHIARTSKEFSHNKVSNKMASLPRENRGKIEDENE